jgi:hypothetical protein
MQNDRRRDLGGRKNVDSMSRAGLFAYLQLQLPQDDLSTTGADSQATVQRALASKE